MFPGVTSQEWLELILQRFFGNRIHQLIELASAESAAHALCSAPMIDSFKKAHRPFVEKLRQGVRVDLRWLGRRLALKFKGHADQQDAVIDLVPRQAMSLVSEIV